MHKMTARGLAAALLGSAALIASAQTLPDLRNDAATPATSRPTAWAGRSSGIRRSRRSTPAT